MSRTRLIRPRRPRAVSDRPATDTRLLPNPFPLTIPPFNSHYKRCSKAERLSLRSDQSTSRSQHGRFPDKSRLALSKGPCQVRAPLTRRTILAPSGDASEHSVMSLPRAIAPPPDSPGLDLAGESEQSDTLRLKTNAPFKDSTVVTIGDLRSTNAGLGSTLPSLRMVEHFWWSRLPHTEITSRLFHILSEARGCRRVVVRCGTSAVADNTHRYRRRRLLAQPSGTFHPPPLPPLPTFRPVYSVIPAEAEPAPAKAGESIPGGGAGALPPP